MRKVPTPPVPDLARAEGDNLSQLVDWFVDYYNAPIVPWSYLTGTRICKTAYRGLHDLPILLSGCERESIDVSRKSNSIVVRLAAPLAFGRDIQVFNLSSRKFEFGHGFRAGYRIPFFFTENGIIKLYYLQPRMNYSLNDDQLGMLATIHKMFILDQEFFGMQTDVEYVDVSASTPSDSKSLRIREVKVRTLRNLKLWDYEQIETRLSMISDALRYIQSNSLVLPRPVKEISLPDMPLFR